MFIGCPSVFENITWNDVIYGDFDVQPCPRGAKGLLKSSFTWRSVTVIKDSITMFQFTFTNFKWYFSGTYIWNPEVKPLLWEFLFFLNLSLILFQGFAKRNCSSAGDWYYPDYTDCKSDEFDSLRDQVSFYLLFTITCILIGITRVCFMPICIIMIKKVNQSKKINRNIKHVDKRLFSKYNIV